MKVANVVESGQVPVDAINPGENFLSGNRLWIRVGGETDPMLGDRAAVPTAAKPTPLPGAAALDLGSGLLATFPWGFPVQPVTVAVTIAQGEGGGIGGTAGPVRLARG